MKSVAIARASFEQLDKLVLARAFGHLAICVDRNGNTDIYQRIADVVPLERNSDGEIPHD